MRAATRPRGGGVMAMLARPLLRRIDRGLAAGSLTIALPDGTVVHLGGRAPGIDAAVSVHRWRAFARLVAGGSVGWFDASARGEWDSRDPVALLSLFGANRATLGRTARPRGPSRLLQRLRHAWRRNSIARAPANIMAHYDLGNDFYAAWLDAGMTYSSARWPAPDVTLADAQAHKIATMLDRAGVGAGTRLLEIGCGWGALAGAAAARGANVTAISLSPAQLEWAAARHPSVTFQRKDYRAVTGTYDAIASVEMVEAVGEAYWPAFLDTIAARLAPGGRAAIQYIAIPDDAFAAYRAHPDFIQTHIFPGGMVLHEGRFRALAAARGLRWTDAAHFAPDYARTLREWRDRFDAAAAAGRLPARCDARFCHLWRYYLMYCEAGFATGAITVAQVTLVKDD